MAYEKKKVTNMRQFECLVEYMENHPSIAKGRKYAENLNEGSYKRLWEELAKNLNSCGPPLRKPEEWEKVWSDFKTKVRRKIIENKKELRATGGGENKLLPINSLEEVVVKILSLDIISKRTVEYGIVDEEENEIVPSEPYIPEVLDDINRVINIENIPPEPTAPSPAPGTFRQSIANGRTPTSRTPSSRLRNKNTTNYKEHTDLLKENVRLLSENNKLLKKIYYLKKNKFEFLKKSATDREKRKIKDQEIQMNILEYKKKKLMLEEVRNRISE